MKVNAAFNDRGEKPRFMFQPNPLVQHAFLIFEYKDDKNAYEPVGEYILLDTAEALDITHKKLENMMKILNEKQNLINFENLTNERVLFNVVKDEAGIEPSPRHKVVFRTFTGNGISKENAVLTIEKGVFDEV